MFAAFVNRRVGVLAMLGFASGLPLALSGDTLQQWLIDARFDITTIGWLKLVTLPYILKFLWAPAMDRFVPPMLGRRRGWLAVTQILLVLAIAGLASADPARALWPVAAMALAVAFFSASQDIVADAYRADVLPTDERGPGASLFVAGYRVAMLASGAGMLVLVDRGASWQTVYLLAAGVMGLGLVATLIAEEPPRGHAPTEPRRSTFAATVANAIILPLRDFLARPNGWMILLFVILFRLPDSIAGVMTGPFLRQVGLSKTDIATIRQGLGIAITIAGALVGGGIVTRIGLRPALYVFGILQAVSNLGFLLLAKWGASYGLFVGVIVVENFSGGLVTAGFFVFLMNQCRADFSATQYALLSSLMAVAGIVVGSVSGQIVQSLGYFWFFLISIACAVPGMLMLPWVPTRIEPGRIRDSRRDLN